MDRLTDAQFSQVNDKIDNLLLATKRGTPERAAAEVVSAEWERVVALPDATWQQRKDRREAIASAATQLGLL